MSDESLSISDLDERLENVERKLNRIASRLDRRLQLDRGFGRLGLLVGAVVALARVQGIDFGQDGAEQEFVLGLIMGAVAWLLVYLLGWGLDGFRRDT